MAYLISKANGNWTDSATWATVDSTAVFDTSSYYYTSLPTAPSWTTSTTFVPGAITIDAIAVRMWQRNAGAATASLTVSLYNSSDSVEAAAVVVPIADIPVAAATDGGWLTFKLAAPVTLLAGKNYVIRMQVSSGTTASLNFWCSGNYTNWQHMLRISGSSATPGAGDYIHIAPEYTAGSPGSWAYRTVTMDNTATTLFGPGGAESATTYRPALEVSHGCTLTWGTAAATNYVLNVAGDVYVRSSGSFLMGTDVTPIPRGSTATFQLGGAATTATYVMTICNGATFKTYGVSRTDGKNVVMCLLTADRAVGGAAWTVDRDTGWLSGDKIAIATTTTTVANAELKTLSVDATATTLTTATNAAYTHEGNGIYVAEIINLTRNVVVKSLGSSASYYAQITAKSGATTLHGWTSFQDLYLQYYPQSGAPMTMDYCAYEASRSNSMTALLRLEGSSSLDYYTLRNSVWYSESASCLYAGDTSPVATNGVITDFTCVCRNGANWSFFLSTWKGTMQRIRSSGGSVSVGAGSLANPVIGTVSDFIAHGGAYTGITVRGKLYGNSLSNFLSWRNGSGIVLSADNTGYCWVNVTLTNFKAVGNTTAGFAVELAAYLGIVFNNCEAYGTVAYPQPLGLKRTATSVMNPCLVELTFNHCAFHDHTTADFDWMLFNTTAPETVRLTFNDSVVSSTTKFRQFDNVFVGQSYVSQQKTGNAAGAHSRWYFGVGTLSRDATVTYDNGVTQETTERLTPTSATLKLDSSPIKIPLVAAATAVVSVRARKSATYNGNQPRLICKANPALGIDADVVLDTMTVAVGNWEELTATSPAATGDAGVLTVVVDCDGTAGYVNIGHVVIT